MVWLPLLLPTLAAAARSGWPSSGCPRTTLETARTPPARHVEGRALPHRFNKYDPENDARRARLGRFRSIICKVVGRARRGLYAIVGELQESGLCDVSGGAVAEGRRDCIKSSRPLALQSGQKLAIYYKSIHHIGENWGSFSSHHVNTDGELELLDRRQRMWR